MADEYSEAIEQRKETARKHPEFAAEEEEEINKGEADWPKFSKFLNHIECIAADDPRLGR